jgi:hypothetical protein
MFILMFDFLLCFPVMALPDPVKRQAGTTEVCPFTSIQHPPGAAVPTVFCQKLAFYWQIEGFWRSQAEVSGSNVHHLDANVESVDSKVQSAGPKVELVDAKVEPLNPKVQSVDARVGPLSPDIEPADAGVELGNANLQCAEAKVQSTNPKV